MAIKSWLAHAFYQRLLYSKRLEWARWIKDLLGDLKVINSRKTRERG